MMFALGAVGDMGPVNVRVMGWASVLLRHSASTGWGSSGQAVTSRRLRMWEILLRHRMIRHVSVIKAVMMRVAATVAMVV